MREFFVRRFTPRLVSHLQTSICCSVTTWPAPFSHQQHNISADVARSRTHRNIRKGSLTAHSTADAVKARLEAIQAGGQAEPDAAQLPVPHTNFRHELDKALTSFCRRCRIYNCVTHAGPHVRCPSRLCSAGLAGLCKA